MVRLFFKGVGESLRRRTEYAQIAADGNATLELALDSQAAAARGELVTPEVDRALLDVSKSLEGREGHSDGEEAVPSDATVAP